MRLLIDGSRAMVRWCAASWFAPGTAEAQPIQGIYVGAGAKVRRISSSIKIPRSRTVSPKSFCDTRQNLGHDTVPSLGYALGNGMALRGRGQPGLRSSVKGITGAPYLTSGSGTVRNLELMANALFDLDIGSPWVFPYLGAGAGLRIRPMTLWLPP